MDGAKAVRSVQKRGSKRTRVGRTVLYWLARFERIVVLRLVPWRAPNPRK